MRGRTLRSDVALQTCSRNCVYLFEHAKRSSVMMPAPCTSTWDSKCRLGITLFKKSRTTTKKRRVTVKRLSSGSNTQCVLKVLKMVVRYASKPFPSMVTTSLFELCTNTTDALGTSILVTLATMRVYGARELSTCLVFEGVSISPCRSGWCRVRNERGRIKIEGELWIR